MIDDFDIFIIGGGINGCGIARDASGRGYRVGLAEMNDLASGTSSASSKLIHGGLRYLEHYEFRLVREALGEREVLLRMAPHIIRPLRFVLPHHRKMRPAWLLRLGLALYDHIGTRRLLPRTRSITLRSTDVGMPLKPIFSRGFEYSDCWVDDARLVILNAMDAADRGASIAVRTKVESARREGGSWIVETHDLVTRRRSEIRARLLVNAGGPWVDEILQETIGSDHAKNVRLVQGSHIVVPKLYHHDRAYIFQNDDGRVIFIIPYEDKFSLIGTTDRDFEGNPGDVRISAEEIDYLCQAASEYFIKPVRPGDVVWTYSGVRPLHDDGAASAQETTRDYVLRVDEESGQAPLVNVFGGKITTYRRLAEAVLQQIEILIGTKGPAWTAGSTLPGGDFSVGDQEAMCATLAREFPFLGHDLARRLARSYGTRVNVVLGDARSDKDLGKPFGATLTEREVRYLTRHEWALSAEDVVWRRSKLGLQMTGDQIEQLDRWLRQPTAHAGKAVERPPARRAWSFSTDARQVEPEVATELALSQPKRSIGGRFVLAIDQGTSSSRAIIFDEEQSIISTGQRETTQHYPASGWIEHDVQEIWRNVVATCRSAIQAAGILPHQVGAVGIANQRETTVVWDRETGEPLHRAIVWQDRRTASYCADLKRDGVEDFVRERTGLLLDPYFSATKVKWLLDHVDGASARAEKGKLAFGTIDSYLIWRLTGGKSHKTDATNAARTLLFNIRTNAWDGDLCRLFGIPISMLPHVEDCAANFGETVSDLLGAPIPILGVAGDQQAAAMGQACFERGSIKSTYGTGCFVLMNTGDQCVPSRHRLLTTIASRIGGRTCYALEGSIFVAGAAVQWLRDGLAIVKNVAASESLAAEADPEQNVILVPAFAGLGAPYWEPNAQGAILGLNRNSGPREIARAALESVCFQTSDLLEAMLGDYTFDIAVNGLRVDGGMVASDWTMQFLADILGCHIDRPSITETTALGAAWLAGMTAGLWPGKEGFAKTWKLEKRFSPALDVHARQRRSADWKSAVEATLMYARRSAKAAVL